MGLEIHSARGWLFHVVARDEVGFPSIVRDVGTDEEHASPYQSKEAWEYIVCDVMCEAVDGCTVEPDAKCLHGYPSWLLVAGLI